MKNLYPTIRRAGPALCVALVCALPWNATFAREARVRTATTSPTTDPTRSAPAITPVARRLLAISSYHPRVRRSAGMLAARISRARYARYFYPDPTFGVVYSNLPSGEFVFDRTPMTGIEFQVKQPIPFPGRLSLEASIATDAAEIARLKLATEKNDLARRFLETSIDAARLRKLKSLTDNYGRQIRIVSRTARTRYAVGRGNLADLSRANLTHSEYLQRAVQFDGQLQGARQRLAYFYLKNSKESREAAEPNEPEKLNAQSKEPSAENLRAYLRVLETNTAREHDRLKYNSLEIALTKISARTGENKTSLARMDYLPDFEAFAAYRQRSAVANDPVSGEDFTSFGLSMRLPLWSALNNHNKVRAEKKEFEARRLAEQDTTGQVLALAGEWHARKQALDQRIKLYHARLIPQARRARSSAQLAYGTGGVDFDTLLNSWDTLYQQKVKRIELEAERDKLIVALAALHNRVLPAYSPDHSGIDENPTTPTEAN